MSSIVRCRWFDDDGRPIDGGCSRGSSCGFVHPDNQAWSTSQRPRSSRGRGRGFPSGPGRDFPGRSSDTSWGAHRRTSGETFGGASPAARSGGWESPRPTSSKPSESSDSSSRGWGRPSQSDSTTTSDPWGSSATSGGWGSTSNTWNSSGWGSSDKDKDKDKGTSNNGGWGGSSGWADSTTNAWGSSTWSSTDTSNKDALSNKGKEKETSSGWSSGWGSTIASSTSGFQEPPAPPPSSATSAWSSSASTVAPSSPAITAPPNSATSSSGDWTTISAPNTSSISSDPRRRPSVRVDTDVPDAVMSDFTPSTPFPPPESANATSQSKRKVSSQKPKDADVEKWKDPVKLFCQAVDARYRYEDVTKQKERLRHSQHSGYYSRSSPAAQNRLDTERMNIEQTMQVLSKKSSAAIDQLALNTDLTDLRLQELAAFDIPADVGDYLNQVKGWMQLVGPQIEEITQPPPTTEQSTSSANADEEKALPPLDLSQPPQLGDVTQLSERLTALNERVEELKAQVGYSTTTKLWEAVEARLEAYEVERQRHKAESVQAAIVLPPDAEKTLTELTAQLDEARMQQMEARGAIADLNTSIGNNEAARRLLEARNRSTFKQYEERLAKIERRRDEMREQLEETKRKLDAAQIRASQRQEEMRRAPQVEQLHTELASSLKPMLEATVKELVEKHVGAVLKEQLEWYNVDTRKKNELILAYVWDKLVRFSSYVPEVAAGTRQTA